MISLCITTYNRTDLLFESFKQVVDDERISEIVIVDDQSPVPIFNEVYEYTKHISKVKLYRNERNIDCYRNKREAVSKAINGWVIIFDSDNIMTKQYVDIVSSYKMIWKKERLFQPCSAKPNFDFWNYAGKIITKSNVASDIKDATFQTMLNAMNYFVHRDEYLRVWDGSIDPVTSDSLFQNYNWLKAGNEISVLPELEYEHRVHSGSHYQNNVRRTPRGFHESIIQKLKELR
jgi:glycosyltransferase involved in cell wall biosynthesis